MVGRLVIDTTAQYGLALPDAKPLTLKEAAADLPLGKHAIAARDSRVGCAGADPQRARWRRVASQSVSPVPVIALGGRGDLDASARTRPRGGSGQICARHMPAWDACRTRSASSTGSTAPPPGVVTARLERPWRINARPRPLFLSMKRGS